MNTTIVFGAAMVVVGLILVGVGVGWPPARPDVTGEITSALYAQERFRRVSVEYRNGAVNLSGRVTTGADKWDARDAARRALSQPSAVKAIFNSIVSDGPDPMPPTPAGYIDSATGWRIMRGER